MTLTLELPPEVENPLAEDARRKGTTPEELALDNLRRSYAAPTVATNTVREDPTLAIFAPWAADDPVLGPEDAATRQREGDELMVALQSSRMNLEGRTDFRGLLDGDEEEKPQAEAA